MSVDLNKLMALIPVLAGVVNPKVGAAAQTIIQEAEALIAAKKAADPNATTDEIIAKAQAQWDKNIADAQALKNMGHGNP
jgi:hypothetical protein